MRSVRMVASNAQPMACMGASEKVAGMFHRYRVARPQRETR